MENRRDRAACRGVGSALFFPDEEDEDEYQRQATEALMLCAGCVGAAQCLEGALQRGEKSGIWGGIDFGLPREQPFDSPDGLARGLEATRRAAAGEPPEERPWQPERACERCGARVPAGNWPRDQNGPDATCGIPSTFNRGCRCDECRDGKSRYHRRSKRADPARGELA